MLTDEEFLSVIDRTPLVSIDLVMRDFQGRLLLGLRTNEPAKGSWFVPGGRIRKGETLDDAFARITADELGVPLLLSGASLFGAFTHQYETNFISAANVSTHYVVLAYELITPSLPVALPFAQHAEFRWWSEDDAIRSETVHPNNLPYFEAT
jgi:colanic acid biosynthesis protein WcaH